MKAYRFSISSTEGQCTQILNIEIEAEDAREAYAIGLNSFNLSLIEIDGTRKGLDVTAEAITPYPTQRSRHINRYDFILPLQGATNGK